MDERKVTEKRKALEDKSNNELLSIWTAHNRLQWQDEDFEVIKQILTARNVQLPPQLLPKTKDEPYPVSITQINVSLRTMLIFMIKWAIAAIPALLILGLFTILFLSAIVTIMLK